MKRTAPFLLCVLVSLLGLQQQLKGQNIDFARQLVDTLSAPGMHGRGYSFEGDKVAAAFIQQEFKKAGLRSFRDSTYYQDFSMPVNVFPGAMHVALDDRSLVPGVDYLCDPESGGNKGTFPIVPMKSSKKGRTNLSGKFLSIDLRGIKDKQELAMLQSLRNNPFQASGILFITDKKLNFGASSQARGYVILTISGKAFQEIPQEITVDIDRTYQENYQSQNVIGYIPGTHRSDSFIVFSAHYDHLGHMGKATYFPGANDNASGTAMLIDLANHYAKKPPRYSIAFMAFSGEEAGLIGSEYYTREPYFNLTQIKFLINIDLMGNGEHGITLVNGKKHPETFQQVVALNEKHGYLKEVKARGTAANSDHYYFSEKGVPAFFIYSRGAHKAYHDVEDTASNLPFSAYSNLFQLIVRFADGLVVP